MAKRRIIVEMGMSIILLKPRLKKQMKLRWYNRDWRKIRRDLSYFDLGLLDLLLATRDVKNILEFERMVNKYMQMQYLVDRIDAEPLTYRIGGAKQTFARYRHDSENSRESEVLFVG